MECCFGGGLRKIFIIPNKTDQTLNFKANSIMMSMGVADAKRLGGLLWFLPEYHCFIEIELSK